MENKEPILEIGDLVYLTCDTTRKCLMTVAKITKVDEKIVALSVLFVDKNNVPQFIEDMNISCIKKLMI